MTSTRIHAIRRGLIGSGLVLGSIALGLAGCEKTEPVQPSGTSSSNTSTSGGAPAMTGKSTLPPAPNQSRTGAPSSQPAIGSDGRLEMGGRTTTVTPSGAPTAAIPDAPAKSKQIIAPQTEPPKTAGDSGDATVASFAGLAAPKPATWQWRAPSTNMRAAEYTVPGVEGADQAQIIVYQFAGGGTVDENVKRWKSQFRHADGSPVQAKVQEIESDGMTVTIAELTGEYKGMNQTEYKPDHILIAAMVETKSNPVFIQLAGPSKTVSSNREAFMTLLRGLKKSEPMK